MSDERREMTVREAGLLGGQKRRDELGPDGYSELGKKGGATTKERHGADFYSEAGRKGGAAVKEKYGSEFFSEIGRKGGQKVRELIERGKLGVAADLLPATPQQPASAPYAPPGEDDRDD